MLDICCNSGGFAVYAKARGGADEVIGIDLDEEILEIAEKNAQPEQRARCKFVQADLFPWLRDAHARGEQFDVVVLDPAKLTRDREQVIPALKKYNDMNKLAMQVVKPGRPVADLLVHRPGERGATSSTCSAAPRSTPAARCRC